MRALLALLLALVASGRAAPAEPTKRLDDAVAETLELRYRDVALARDPTLEGARVFTRNTRRFTVYRLNKSGDWQAPADVEGPDRGGISVRYRVSPGAWAGALVVPFNGTESLHVFEETLVVRNSGDGRWHIWAQVLLPKVEPATEIRDRLVETFNDFEAFL